MKTGKLVQLYNEDNEKAYPVTNKDGVLNEDGSKTFETIEKKNNAKFK